LPRHPPDGDAQQGRDSRHMRLRKGESVALLSVIWRNNSPKTIATDFGTFTANRPGNRGY
jgi:hypothetical protein